MVEVYSNSEKIKSIVVTTAAGTAIVVTPLRVEKDFETKYEDSALELGKLLVHGVGSIRFMKALVKYIVSEGYGPEPEPKEPEYPSEVYVTVDVDGREYSGNIRY